MCSAGQSAGAASGAGEGSLPDPDHKLQPLNNCSPKYYKHIAHYNKYNIAL